MVYPALLPLMRTPRLPVVDWTDAPADLNGLVRFAERRNLVSARVPSHFKRSLSLMIPPCFSKINVTLTTIRTLVRKNTGEPKGSSVKSTLNTSATFCAHCSHLFVFSQHFTCFTTSVACCGRLCGIACAKHAYDRSCSSAASITNVS